VGIIVLVIAVVELMVMAVVVENQFMVATMILLEKPIIEKRYIIRTPRNLLLFQ
jgi:hypothetical protein